jgi:hypothetical protein
MVKPAEKPSKFHNTAFKALNIKAPANGASVDFTGTPAQYPCTGSVDPAPADMTLYVVDVASGSAGPNTYTLSAGTITLNGTTWTCYIGTSDCPNADGMTQYTIRLTAYDAATGQASPCKPTPIFTRNS